MKYLKKFVLLFVLFFMYSYIVSIDNIPLNIKIFQGEKIDIPTLWGIRIEKQDDETVETASNLNSSTFNKVGEEKLQVSLFDKIKLKTINVEVLEQIEVIPSGQIVGIKLYTNGVLVVGTSSIEGIDGKIYKPFENTEIQEGDSIIEINGVTINSTDELISEVNKSNGEQVELKYIHENEKKIAKIKPIKNKENILKLGLWVRDSAAGVGTMTFYNEETNSFVALGHAITDIDTGEIIQTSTGEIDNVEILSVIKGEKDNPGRIEGYIKSDSILGNIYNNTQFGIYGIIKDINNLQLDFSKKMKVASRGEIELGHATCLSGIDGNVKEFDLEIEKIYLNNNYDNKSMVIKIIDKNLISNTGGIIQGMSGSPIIQNGKFVGAITHVLVNDPQIGYAVFADQLINY